MKTPYHHVRKLAVQVLYQVAVSNIPATEATKDIHEMAEFGGAGEGLFNKLVIGTTDNTAAYMQQIRPLFDHDEKDLSPIERVVLLMAYHELSAMPETSYPVIINEAVEVAKALGSTDGHKFVSGTLDHPAVQLRPNDPKREA